MRELWRLVTDLDFEKEGAFVIAAVPVLELALEFTREAFGRKSISK